jgi:N-acyl-D-amino-acid deacylase
MSHLRSEDDDALFEAIDELLAQGQHARVHIAHLKSVYGRGAARGDAILDKLTAAQRSGLRVSADVYPYSASYTGLALLFPSWAKAPEQFVEAKATRRAELEAYLKARVLSRNGPEATLLGSAPHAGLTLAELAERLEKPFERVLVEDLGPQGGSAAYFIMDEDLQRRFIQDPRVAISSDGSPTGFHPRGHGTFAKIIEQYVQEEGSLTLPEAVRQMTTLPAAQLGIRDRGQLAPGLAADIVVFDPAVVRARATYAEPHRLAEGFDALWVNGVQLRSGGAFTGATGGRVLRPSP